MSLALDLVIRIVVASLIGAIIGYEREYRGKVAGVRTHFLVAMGAALFMIISLYGFEGVEKFDAARVAAGVVGGLGFLGGGIIMKNKHISGLTTAAGIWVTGAIGLSLGAGMYEVSILCALLMLFCMEILHYINFKLGDSIVSVTISSEQEDALLDTVRHLGKQVGRFSMSRQGDVYKADINLIVRKKDYPHAILEKLNSIPGIKLESID